MRNDNDIVFTQAKGEKGPIRRAKIVRSWSSEVSRLQLRYIACLNGCLDRYIMSERRNELNHLSAVNRSDCSRRW